MEVEKKKKCLDPCLKHRRCFTPFVVSCEGMLGREADVFLKNLAKKLASKWERPRSRTTAFIRIRFAISMVRAKNRYTIGSRTMTNSISRRIDWEDGAALVLYSTLEWSWSDEHMHFSLFCACFSVFVPAIFSHNFDDDENTNFIWFICMITWIICHAGDTVSHSNQSATLGMRELGIEGKSD